MGLGGRFIGTASSGFRGGRLLIDPTMDLDLTGFTATGFADISFATPRDALGNLLPDYDLRVRGFFDLNSVQPPPTGGTIRFDAGRDLIFQDLTLWNNPFGQPTRWDIVGVAERNILFTGSSGTTLQTAYGGGIDLWAKNGDVNLIDRTDWSAFHHQDARRRRDLDQDRAGLDCEHGIRRERRSAGPLQHPGNQHRWARAAQFGCRKRFHRRGCEWRAAWPRIRSLEYRSYGHSAAHRHGRRQDRRNQPHARANGLPLTAAELRAQNKPLETESSARYADFALSGGELTVTAGGNIYLGSVRDAGLVGGMDAQGNERDPAFAAGLENNKATFVSREGNIIINTNSLDAGRQGSPLEVLSTLLPASFEARADKGTIQIRSSLKFLPSPTGAVKFFAHQDIQGVPKIGRGDDPNFIWLFVGYGGISGGQWVAIDQRTIPQRPDLWPFLSNTRGSNTLPKIAGDPPSIFPDYAKKDTDRTPPTVKLLEVNPNDLIGNTTLDQVASLVNNNLPIAPDNTTASAPVSFKAELGRYHTLFLDLVSRPFHKEISI